MAVCGFLPVLDAIRITACAQTGLTPEHKSRGKRTAVIGHCSQWVATLRAGMSAVRFLVLAFTQAYRQALALLPKGLFAHAVYFNSVLSSAEAEDVVKCRLRITPPRP